MLKVNAGARLEGLRLAAMYYKGEGKPLPKFSQKELDDMQRPFRFSISEVAPHVKPFYLRAEKFNRKFLKDSDRIFSSDILLAYDWYCSYFKSFEVIMRLGITAADIGFPVERWDEFLSAEWSCQEEVQTCLNLACEMDTKEGVTYMFKKLAHAFSVKQSLGFIPDYWEAFSPLGDHVEMKGKPSGEIQEEPVEEGPKFVTCCFTVTREVGEWLKGKYNMSQFVKDLIDLERKNEG